MKGIYIKSKYVFLLSFIKFCSQKEEIIYFLEKDTIKNLNLDGLNVIVLNNFKKGNYLINKYKKWNFNNKLLKN